MNTPSITTRVADLVRNPNSAMPGKWEHSSKKSQAEAAPKPSSTSAQSQQVAPKPQPAPAPMPKSATADKKGAQSTTLSSGDTITLSPLAMKILDDPNPAPSNWEKAREDRVQRVQQLVQEKQYVLSPEVVDSIAQKIVAMLH